MRVSVNSDMYDVESVIGGCRVEMEMVYEGRWWNVHVGAWLRWIVGSGR